MKVKQPYGSTHTERANKSLAGRPHFASRAAMRSGAIGIISLALVVTLALASSSQAATAVGLGTADNFAVLAGSGVTNTGPSVVNGDLGSSPTPSVTGFGGAPNGTVNGSTHQADASAAQAQADLTTAYNNAAGQGPASTVATELGGQTLTPGVYDSLSGTFGITGTLTLNAKGNPNAVFIFKTASTLISASASQVRLINGAQPCHLFWQVGSSATLGTSSTFVGNILALQSISLDSGVTVNGRLLARNGAVTLINDTITRAQCGTGGGGGGGGPTVQITGVPGALCINHGFRAKFKIHDAVGMRRVNVFLDGKLIKRSTHKQFSVWVSVAGLRSGRNTIRVVAVDLNGKRDTASRSFRRCAPAVPSPNFTG